MDRFVSKRSAPSPTVSTRVSKKPKVSDKQGEKSADYRAKEFGAVFYTSGGNFSANHATQWWITSENLRSESILSQRYVRLSMFRLFFNNCLSRYFLEVAKTSTDRCIMVHSIGRVKIDSKS